MNEKRHHPRLVHLAPVRVVYTTGGPPRELQMHNFSDTGMFILCRKSPLPAVGERMQVKTLEFEDAPLLDVKVTRVEAGKGFAVEFI